MEYAKRILVDLIVLIRLLNDDELAGVVARHKVTAGIDDGVS